MIVGDKRTRDDTVEASSHFFTARVMSRVCAYLEANYGRRLAKGGAGLFSPARFGYFYSASDPRVKAADVVCLYWINGAFMRPESLSGISQPLIWRLSDIWPFSGGCHYPGGCERFVGQCGECPQLVDLGAEDYSKQLWTRKAKAWEGLDLTIVAPSRWMADMAAKSSLFRNRRIEVIATGVDTSVFRPLDRVTARVALGLPEGHKIIAFGAAGATADSRKGWTEFARAIHQAVQRGHGHNWHVALFGTDAVQPLPLPVTVFGRINDEAKLARLLAAVDVVAVPSREDNLPQIALEALASGTPVVAFRVGGLPDAITHRENGWLAEAGDIAGFADGLAWVLSAGEGPRQAARRSAETYFSQKIQIKRYISLLSEVAGSRRHALR